MALQIIDHRGDELYLSDKDNDNEIEVAINNQAFMYLSISNIKELIEYLQKQII